MTDVTSPQIATTTVATAAPVAESPSVSVVTPSSSEVAAGAEISATSPVVESAPAADVIAPEDDVLGGEGIVADEVSETVVEKVEEDTRPKEDAGDKKDAPKESATADAPAELPKFEEFALPEGITLADDVKGEFSKLLGEMEVGKLDHEGIQAQGQKFIDLGTKLVTESLERMNEHYVAIHEKQKSDWFQEFKNDPEIGGARTNTTINTVRGAIETYGGTEEQITRFRDTTKKTGVTNNPDVIRLISNMANTIARFTTEQEVGTKDTRIVPGARPAPTKVKGYQSFYGKSGG